MYAIRSYYEFCRQASLTSLCVIDACPLKWGKSTNNFNYLFCEFIFFTAVARNGLDMSQTGGLIHFLVITSYSIHYTKLYEARSIAAAAGKAGSAASTCPPLMGPAAPPSRRGGSSGCRITSYSIHYTKLYETFNRGDLWVIGGMLAWSLYTVSSQALGHWLPSIPFALLTMIAGGGALLSYNFV